MVIFCPDRPGHRPISGAQARRWAA